MKKTYFLLLLLAISLGAFAQGVKTTCSNNIKTDACKGIFALKL